jgi:hypothetical protein
MPEKCFNGELFHISRSLQASVADLSRLFMHGPQHRKSMHRCSSKINIINFLSLDHKKCFLACDFISVQDSWQINLRFLTNSSHFIWKTFVYTAHRNVHVLHKFLLHIVTYLGVWQKTGFGLMTGFIVLLYSSLLYFTNHCMAQYVFSVRCSLH